MTATTDADGQPDWLLHYTPGPKARAEYAAFLRQPGAEAPPPSWRRPRPTRRTGGDTRTRRVRPHPRPDASGLRHRDGSPPGTMARGARGPARLGPRRRPSRRRWPTRPRPRRPGDGLLSALPRARPGHALAQRTGARDAARWRSMAEAKAHFLLAFSHQAAPETHYQPQTFGGILHYLPRALAAYEARATQATTQQAAADARALAGALPAVAAGGGGPAPGGAAPEELAALEAAHQARLVAAGTRAFALGLAVRVAVDAALEARAGLPSFEVWRQTQEAGR